MRGLGHDPTLVALNRRGNRSATGEEGGTPSPRPRVLAPIAGPLGSGGTRCFPMRSAFILAGICCYFFAEQIARQLPFLTARQVMLASLIGLGVSIVDHVFSPR